MPGLPTPPSAAIVVKRVVGTSEGFLTVRRLLLAIASNGETSEPFQYDVIDRAALHAAVIAAHLVKDGVRHVVLRSAMRPPFSLAGENGVLWELPAGLIEAGEDPNAAAARELNEEIGTRLGAERLLTLGKPITPAPAMIAEWQHLFHVEIDESELGPPPGDGSALERASILALVPLDDALALAREGAFPDAKTEIGLRRLVEALR